MLSFTLFLWILYYSNGNKYITSHIKNNKKNGLYEEFYENGNLHQRLNFINDI